MPELPETGKVEDIRHPFSDPLLHLPVSSIRIFEIPDETRRKLALGFLEPLDGTWSDSGLNLSLSLEMKPTAKQTRKPVVPILSMANKQHECHALETHFQLRQKNDEKQSTEFKRRK